MKRWLVLLGWHYFLSDKPYRCTCPNLPPGEGAPADACEEQDAL